MEIYAVAKKNKVRNLQEKWIDMDSYIQCGNQVHRDNDPRSPLYANPSHKFLESDAQH